MIRRGLFTSVLTFLLYSFLSFHAQGQPIASAGSELLGQEGQADCGLFFQLFDNSCTASSNYNFTITDAPGNQMGTDVLLEEIRLIIEHDWVGDLEIYLTSPSGVKIPLSLNNGRGGQNYGNPAVPDCEIYTAFTRNACLSIANGQAPFVGTFLPQGNLNDFNDNSDPNGQWTLQVCDVQPDNVGWLQYVDLIFSDNICQAPTEVSVDLVDANSAAFRWSSSNSNCADFILEYGPPGFQPSLNGNSTNGTIVIVPCLTNQPYTLTGLDEFTTYDIYIRETCGSAAFSPNSCKLQFSTSCMPPSASLSESFNSQGNCGDSCSDTCEISGTWYNARTTDDMDWLVRAGRTRSSKTGPSDDVSGGGQYIYLESSNRDCPDASTTELRSNCLEIDTAFSNCHLSFFYHMYGSETGSLQLDASIDGGANWIILWILSGEQGDQWYQQFIDLSFFHDQVVQFRFLGTRGSSFKSDIAIDQIEFYGAQDLGRSIYTYFADVDGDGYGNPAMPIGSCAPDLPDGYVNNDLDCDDGNEFVNPGMPEILCNGVDEACDGLQNDSIVLNPVLENRAVCEGENAIFEIDRAAMGNYYWYGTNSTNSPVLATGQLLNIGLVDQSRSFFVMDSLPEGCRSELIEVQLIVHSRPELNSMEAPRICSGTAFDLTQLNINDAQLTGGDFQYYAADPALGTSPLGSPVVTINANTTYFIEATSPQGCQDVISINFEVDVLPSVQIDGPTEVDLCANERIVLSGSEAGTGLPPFEYAWNSGSSRNRIKTRVGMPGTTEWYVLTITDANQCEGVDSVAIQTLESVTAVAIEEIVNVSDCNGSDGRIDLLPVNGQAPYNYSWAGPVNGQLFNQSGLVSLPNLQQGSYRVTISDASGKDCSMILPVLIVNGPSVIVDTNIIVTPTTCPERNDGRIDINILAGNPDFLWNTGQTTEDIDQLAAGTYSVTISEGTCVYTLNGISVGSPDSLDLEIGNLEAVSCKDLADGRVSVVAAGGTLPYTYQWGHGPTENELEGLLAGTYELTLSDANNCETQLTAIEITEPEALFIRLDQIKHVSCYGGMDGAIDIEITGGTAPYSYEWSDLSDEEDLLGQFAGTYQLTVTDANACELISDPITIEQADSIQIISTITPASCDGVDNGAIRLEVVGGTGPFTYLWSNGEQGNEIRGLSIAVFEVTITDANGCRALFGDFEITAPEVMRIARTAIFEPACMGVNDGFIELEIRGGTPPYTYNWEDGSTNRERLGLTEGDYQLTVTDANGCRFVTPVFDLRFLTPLAYSLAFSSNISCYGRADGSILISPEWNSPDFTYEWNNGGTTPFINRLAAGPYVCTITSDGGCRLVTDTIQITEPDSIDVAISNLEAVNCFGLADGNLDVRVSGGTMPYNFSWSNGAATEDLIAVAAGSYVLTIRDANNCAYSSPSFELNESEPLEVELVEIVNVGCAGSANGSIEVAVSGGQGPFRLNWSTGDSSLVLNKVAPGNYNLTVVDANSCELVLEDLEVLRLPDSLTIEIADSKQVSCFGAADGQIELGTINGQAPFQYNWSNGSTDSLNRDLGPGEYEVTITDRNGCVGISELILIEEPEAFGFNVVNIGGLLCTSDSTGFIEINVSGGTAPYQYEWSHGDSLANPRHLPAGQYQLTITDADGCSFSPSQAILLTAPEALTLSGVEQENISCFGEANGQLNITVSGGRPAYQYLWSNGDTTSTIQGLEAGDYTCIITDSLNCSIQTDTLTILSPLAPLSLTPDSILTKNNAYCEAQNNGQIDLRLSGGTPGYTYFWNTGARTASIDQLSAGIYTCYIEDANACLLETEPISILNTDPMQVAFDILPASGGLANGQATANVRGGSSEYTYQWDAQANNQSTSTAFNLSNGLYYLTITDSDNCVLIDSVLVDPSVGIQQTDQLDRWQVYPNPSQGQLFIRADLTRRMPLELRLYNALGQLIKREKSGSSQQHRWDWDVENIASGIYFIQLQGAGQTLSIDRILLQIP